MDTHTQRRARLGLWAGFCLLFLVLPALLGRLTWWSVAIDAVLAWWGAAVLVQGASAVAAGLRAQIQALEASAAAGKQKKIM